MALLERTWFNAVYGGIGGLIGWMLFGVLAAGRGDDTPAGFLGGAIVGGSIGYFVVSVDALRDQALVRFCRLASLGTLLGGVGGALGMTVGDLINYHLLRALAGTIGPLAGAALARGLGWMLLGVAIGISEGIAARSLGKLSYGTLGGALGGFVGGAVFALLYVGSLRSGGQGLGAFGGAIGLVVLGACIGALSALVQAAFQPASVRVLRGWQEGREYPLDRAETSLGRDEGADIALFRDMKVEKHHALIQRVGRDYRLRVEAPPGQTLLNGSPAVGDRPLSDGDRVQLGNVLLRFQLRAAQARSRRRPRA